MVHTTQRYFPIKTVTKYRRTYEILAKGWKKSVQGRPKVNPNEQEAQKSGYQYIACILLKWRLLRNIMEAPLSSYFI